MSLTSLSNTTEVIILCDCCGNDESITEFVLSDYPNVSMIDIGNNCFYFVTSFKLQNLPQLESLTVGWKSFHHISTKGRFSIQGCSSLVHIDIGLESFYDYEEFQLSGRCIDLG